MDINLNEKFVAACLIVKQGDETLVLRRKDWEDKICFPGGKQEQGERADKAVVREFFEETGVTIPCDAVQFLGAQYRERAKGKVVFFGADFANCSGVPSVQEADNHSFVGFLKIDDVIKEVGVKNIAFSVLSFLKR